jgi:hypothetical protein
MTTPTESTKAEIERFLCGSDPEVLCVTGEWGVGKTFLWRSTLKRIRELKVLKLTRYSYVSLFGSKSLDDVKSALFENMEWLDQEDLNFAQRGQAGMKALFGHAKRFTRLVEALPLPWNLGQVLAKAGSFSFSLIRNQIVCVDDLDRRSNNLELKDVLGLISFLREQRGCKVVLLLNDEQLGDKKKEFDGLLEKVVETKVVLAPTPAESAAIALPDQDAISTALRAHCETLGIRNIRVIKQIERLAQRIHPLLTDFAQSVRDQAVHSLTLFGWSKYDREHAPNMEFLKISSLERQLSKRDGDAPQSDEEANWESLLEKYNFTLSDDFDVALMKYVDSMILDTDEILNEARALQERKRIGELNGTYAAAWRKYHDSFDDNEDDVVREIVDSVKKCHEIMSLSNLNETVQFLKRLGRKAEATDVLEFFAGKHNEAGFWNPHDDPFARGPYDPDISAVKEQKKAATPKEFDVAEALVRAGRDLDAETIAKLATVPVQTYYDLISAAREEQLRSLVSSALDFRRILNATNDMRQVVGLMEEALRMIGRKSRLNALRVSKYGISVDESEIAEKPAPVSRRGMRKSR